MNIIEAVKSGKRFHRPGQLWITTDIRNTYCHEDLLREDWEVEEKKVEITYAKLHAAYCKACPGIVEFTGTRPVFVYPDFEKMAKELGLID